MGSAKRWWNQEEKDRVWYKEPSLRTWGQLKLLMRERYAPQMLSQPGQNTYPSKEPSRENTTHQRVSSKHNADISPAKKNEKGIGEREDSASIPLLKLQDKQEQGLSHMMDDNDEEFNHHVATPREVKNDISLKEKFSETTASQKDTGTIEEYHDEQETTSQRILNVEQTEKLAKSDNMHPNQEIKMCLPPIKDDEVSTNNILLQEEPPDQSSNQSTLLILKDTLTEEPCQVQMRIIMAIYQS
ncbi:uncharacterized protein LOC111830493 [Capsella rubella]|uniref:uncharacterized protein LOC111830493 n=1 Tax=Capsella rubella TaxID=81985 RepID=UPI000CD57691|nr:uncharacterized protein LOC111830493 [Capsella rubella]